MDTQLIRACLNRKQYETLHPKIPMELVGHTTRVLLQWVGAFYTSNPNVNELTPNDLKNYITLRNPHSLEDSGMQVLITLCDTLNTEPRLDVPTLLTMLLEQDFIGRVGNIYLRYQQGDDIDAITEIETLTKEYAAHRKVQEIETYSILETLEALETQKGMRLEGMQFLKEYIAPFGAGTSIAIAARPNAGKSSLLCYLLTKSCPSIREYFGEDRPILFGVNEGDPARVVPRLYQAALESTLTELYAKRDAGTLIPEYEAALGTHAGYIQPMSIAGWDFHALERKLEELRPSVVVVDMLEHVGMKGFSSKAERTTEQWIKIRELALVYECVAISTVQIGYEGANNLFPSYDHLNYSKTGIQAATDIILMMGSLTDPSMQHVRGFNTAKNKFSVEGKPSIVEAEATFDKDRSVFHDGF